MINPKLLFLVLGFILGLIALSAVHFVNLESDETHYHANFALHVNGVRDEFKSFAFYEEVQECSLNDKNNVKARVHMHDQKNNLIHVHDNGVTWGQFFANLGYTLGNKAISTDKGTFVDGANDTKLTFILNGEPTTNIENKVINSEDALLINFGNESSDALKQKYNSIEKDAKEHNAEDDPVTCSGGATLSFTSRLKKSFGLNP